MSIPAFQADLIFLAAGEGRRAGGSKAWRQVRGRPWLARQLDSVAGLFAASPIAILPREPEPSQLAALPFEPRRAFNPHPESGPFSSLHLALTTFPSGERPAFVLPVDVPAPGVDVFRALMDACRDAAAAVPTCGGRGGHPVLLPPAARKELMDLDPRAEGSRLDAWLRSKGAAVRRVATEDHRVTTNLNSDEDFEAFERTL